MFFGFFNFFLPIVRHMEAGTLKYYPCGRNQAFDQPFALGAILQRIFRNPLLDFKHMAAPGAFIIVKRHVLILNYRGRAVKFAGVLCRGEKYPGHPRCSFQIVFCLVKLCAQGIHKVAVPGPGLRPNGIIIKTKSCFFYFPNHDSNSILSVYLSGFTV